MLISNIFPQYFQRLTWLKVVKICDMSFMKHKTISVPHINPLPHVPILGSSNTAANKDMATLWTNGDTII